MLQSNEKIIKHKVGLLNLAEELGNVSKACQMMSLSRDTFYRYRDAVEDGGVEAPLERPRRATNLKNRVEHVNGIKGLVFAQGVSDYQPVRRDRRQQLETLGTGDGRPLPICPKQRLSRELERLELVLERVRKVNSQRDALLASQTEVPFFAPVAMLYQRSWHGDWEGLIRLQRKDFSWIRKPAAILESILYR